MADTVSQETLPTNEPVTDSATIEQAQPVVTEDYIREKIQKGKIGNINELNSLLGKMNEGAPEAPKIELTEDSQPVPEPPQAAVQPEPAETPVVSDEFLAEVHKAGFTYRNKGEVIKGLLQKEKAVDTFKTDAIKNRTEAEKAKADLEKALKRQAELESLLKSNQSQPAPQQTAPIPQQSTLEMPLPPEMPKYSLDEEEYNRNLDSYNKNVQDYYKQLDAYNEQKLNQTISQVKTEITQKVSDKDKILSEIKQDLEAKKLREKKLEKMKKDEEVLNKAFEAAEAFYKKDENQVYRLSKPVRDQHSEYLNLSNALNYMVIKDPSLASIAGNDPTGNLIREHINGNPYVMQALANHDINVTDDIKNFQLLVDLEADATAHNDFDDQGRPDLDMALLRQKKYGGILLQEKQDAKVEGFTEAQRLMQMNTAGAAQLPTTVPSPSTTSSPEMTQEQLLDKMRWLKTLPDSQRVEETEKLRPFFAKHGLIKKE